MHQGYSLFHRKPPPKFEIEALFRLVMLYTDKKKKKYIIVKSIHSSLRSESKNTCSNFELNTPFQKQNIFRFVKNNNFFRLKYFIRFVWKDNCVVYKSMVVLITIILMFSQPTVGDFTFTSKVTIDFFKLKQYICNYYEFKWDRIGDKELNKLILLVLKIFMVGQVSNTLLYSRSLLFIC
ncbi:hypothetical protein AGLY_010519 [Aphis glycines]|uniref:Uncharacterized protein n=1 Tax=Aphis glycines TaxID=307491 RepID=A0A6G0TG06_APHGL|nr:hypothetical protein AGLY_010519 [Aphis glycines]